VKLTKGYPVLATWEERFEEMLEYYHKNKTFLPKREGPLRDWMIDLVSILQKGDTLTKKKMAKIKETKIEKYLKPEVIYADDNAFSRE